MARKEVLSGRIRSLILFSRKWACKQVKEGILVRGEKLVIKIMVMDDNTVKVIIKTPKKQSQRFFLVTDRLTSADWGQILGLSMKPELRGYLKQSHAMNNEPQLIDPVLYRSVNALFWYRQLPYRLKWTSGRYKTRPGNQLQLACLWRMTSVDSPRGFP